MGLKQRLPPLLRRHAFAISRLLFVASCAALFIAPALFKRGVYVDENALGVGRVQYKLDEGRFADLVETLRSAEGSLSEVYRLAAERVPAHTILHLRHLEAIVIHLRAPRGTGQEGLLVYADSGRPMSVALALTLSEFVARVNWLSSDVVIVLADRQGLAKYTDLLREPSTRPNYSPLPLEVFPPWFRAGIAIDFANNDFREVRIRLFGHDGELPNFDTVSTTLEILTGNGIQTRVEEEIKGNPMLSFIHCLGANALGVASGPHGDMRRSGIHSISLQNVATGEGEAIPRGHSTTDTYRRIVKSLIEWVRAFNNLHEDLHHSHFIYFLSTSEHFVSFDIVNACVWIAVGSIIVRLLATHYTEPAITKPQEAGDGNKVLFGYASASALCALAMLLAVCVLFVVRVAAAVSLPFVALLVTLAVLEVLAARVFLSSAHSLLALSGLPPVQCDVTARACLLQGAHMIAILGLSTATVWAPAVVLVLGPFMYAQLWLAYPTQNKYYILQKLGILLTSPEPLVVSLGLYFGVATGGWLGYSLTWQYCILVVLPCRMLALLASQRPTAT